MTPPPWRSLALVGNKTLALHAEKNNQIKTLDVTFPSPLPSLPPCIAAVIATYQRLWVRYHKHFSPGVVRGGVGG